MACYVWMEEIMEYFSRVAKAKKTSIPDRNVNDKSKRNPCSLSKVPKNCHGKHTHSPQSTWPCPFMANNEATGNKCFAPPPPVQCRDPRRSPYNSKTKPNNPLPVFTRPVSHLRRRAFTIPTANFWLMLSGINDSHAPLHSAQFRSGMVEFTVSLKTPKFTVKTSSSCHSAWLLNKRPVVSVMKTCAASSSASDSTPPSSLPHTHPTQSSGAMNNLFTALCRCDNILERRQREITALMVLRVRK